mgnify:CR=1 FL=1
MRLFRNMFAALVMALASLSLQPAVAQDAVIDQAKAQGIVGEMYTGYLGIADSSRATADLRRRVDEVNARRLSIYTETSQRTGESVSTIAALTAEKQIGRAMSGEAVNPGAGQPWQRKP